MVGNPSSGLRSTRCSPSAGGRLPRPNLARASKFCSPSTCDSISYAAIVGGNTSSSLDKNNIGNVRPRISQVGASIFKISLGVNANKSWSSDADTSLGGVSVAKETL